MSFFSKSLYRDVARNWSGLGFPYLLALLALCTIPAVMNLHTDLVVFLNNEGREFVQQVPAITISKGKVSIDKPEPYFIRDKKTGDPIMIIDTTGTIRSLHGTSAKALLTKTGLLVKKDKGETATLDLSTIDFFFINRSLLYEYMDSMEEWFAVMIYPLAVLVSFLYHVVEVLVYAAVGLIFTRALHASLGYRALVRLSVISVTPSLVVGVLLLLTDTMLPYWRLISFWVSLVYLLYAVKANAGNKEMTLTA